MPSPKTPGRSNIHKFQRRDVDIGLRRCANGSALPELPQLRFTRAENYEASTVRAFATACQVARRPCTDLTGFPANGAFYFQASNGLVALPVAGYDYSIDWTPMLAGLSPAGMATRLAAPLTGFFFPLHRRDRTERNWTPRHHFRPPVLPHQLTAELVWRICFSRRGIGARGSCCRSEQSQGQILRLVPHFTLKRSAPPAHAQPRQRRVAPRGPERWHGELTSGPRRWYCDSTPPSRSRRPVFCSGKPRMPSSEIWR